MLVYVPPAVQIIRRRGLDFKSHQENILIFILIKKNSFKFIFMSVCAQWRMSLSPPGSLLATDRSKAVVLV